MDAIAAAFSEMRRDPERLGDAMVEDARFEASEVLKTPD